MEWIFYLSGNDYADSSENDKNSGSGEKGNMYNIYLVIQTSSAGHPTILKLVNNYCNWASRIRKHLKNVNVSVSKWSGHNKCNNNAITDIFVAWKHGHIDAAVL